MQKLKLDTTIKNLKETSLSSSLDRKANYLWKLSPLYLFLISYVNLEDLTINKTHWNWIYTQVMISQNPVYIPETEIGGKCI